jgi:serine O-acetyltransferase
MKNKKMTYGTTLFSEYIEFHKWLIDGMIKRTNGIQLNYSRTLSSIKKRDIPESTIFHHKGIGTVIGSGVDLGENIHIFPHVTLGASTLNNDKFPTVEDNCIIYTHATIIGNITIGHDSIIGAHTLVREDVPPYSFVVGNPAKITRRTDI